MSFRLTATQRAYLRSEPLPPNESTKIRLAVRLAGANLSELAAELDMSPVQLGRYVNGGDIRISTARRIVGAFGLGLDDLFPPPAVTPTRRTAKPTRSSRRSSVSSSPTKRAPKASIGAAA